MIEFALALPAIRQRVQADLKKPPLSRDACAGRRRDAAREDADPRRQQGVRARQQVLRVDDASGRARADQRRVADLSLPREERRDADHRARRRHARPHREEVRALPGQTLFQYLDANGKRQCVDSVAVNTYLRAITGQPFTAKNFRTWAGDGSRRQGRVRRCPKPRRTPRSSGTSSARSIQWRRSWAIRGRSAGTPTSIPACSKDTGGA